MTSTSDVIRIESNSNTINYEEYDDLDSSQYKMNKEEHSLKNYIGDITGVVKKNLGKSIDDITPWFFKNMPNIYYHTTPRLEKIKHLSSVISNNIFESRQTIQLWNQDRSKTTFIGPAKALDSFTYLAQKVEQLNPRLGWLYVAHDNLLFIATFFCRPFSAADFNNQFIKEKIQTLKQLINKDPSIDPQFAPLFVKNLDHDFIKYTTPNRLHLYYKMISHMLNHESSHTFLTPMKKEHYYRLVVGYKGVKLSQVFEEVSHLIGRYEHKYIRYFVHTFDKGYNEPIIVIYFIIKTNEKKNKDQISVLHNKLTKALRTISWTDSDNYIQFTRPPFFLSTNAASLVRGLSVWIKILLSKENPYYYSDYNILTTFLRHRSITHEIIRLFRLKFDPRQAQDRQFLFEKTKVDLQLSIDQIIDKVQRTILYQALTFIDHCLKTNYFFQTKTGLAFRLDPNILDPKHYSKSPYGIFYVIGRNYRFFHVRWKNVSRGGLRVVTPTSSIDYEFAISGLFDEVYGLSYAQQLKNKDIPEGGSKGVLIVSPKGNKNRVLKGAINALLDLIVTEDENHEDQRSSQVSYYNEEEILYLGPDENISNEMIDWIQAQAQRRGYPYARSFMSSKLEDGINHKVYGVTSRGLHVYIPYILKHLNIDPEKDSFTVKMTGGPDGDVAGNELKLLYKSYKNQCKIVAVADGFGAAHDSSGLSWNELLRLVEEEKSICEFNKDLLSKNQSSFVVDISTRENIKKRNHIHNEAIADLFIPAGGRPYTINSENVNNFFTKDSIPSTKAIIEGANIFISEQARSLLQEKGVYIIKDSSANKTGVICSSFEIIASLALSKHQFLEIKETYIKEVLHILEEKARLEANLLMNEFSKYENKLSLTDLSQKLSQVINQLTDLIMEHLNQDKNDFTKNLIFQETIIKHCPKCIQKRYHDQILNKLPLSYQLAIVASHIASYITYKEGIYWIESIPQKDRFKVAIAYLKNDTFMKKIIADFENKDFENKEHLSLILQKTGARILTTEKYNP